MPVVKKNTIIDNSKKDTTKKSGGIKTSEIKIGTRKITDSATVEKKGHKNING